MKQLLFFSHVAFASLLLVSSAAPAQQPKPNIVFILADDLGLDGVGCYGSDVYKKQTPNIDALAKGGTRFENCYASPLCGPSRCLLMTGRYAFRTGGLTNQSWQNGNLGAKSKDEYPIARLLKENGYATCQAGKWRQIGETPKDWGFDEYCTDNTAGGWYWRKQYIKNGQVVKTAEQVYCPDIVHDFAIDFINKNKEKPFFLYYAPHLVHLPMERTPDSKADTKDEKTLYADNLAYLDKQVGLVVKELEKLKLREKTLIVFSGDNGTAAKFPTTVDGKNISGHKGQMLEGGSRVPLIANWPSTTPEGKVLKDLVDFSDMYATFAEVAGAKMPTSLLIDSVSYAPQLKGEPGKPREWIYVQLGAKWYVRSPGWKLIQSGEFYDMKNAPFVEKPIPSDTKDAEAVAAREKLQKVLDGLKPGAGKVEVEGKKE
ncbi:MAG TPA: sulfatase-like hydrolase/transferase [Gemmataceae bacterium]|jgi:arylsulfatase A|nr:sulfatase-like hydrolase/transferase [Gemmataceae bacterium]